MPAIRIVPFRGMLPRVAARLLGDGAAVDATNIDITSGEIRPLRRPVLVHTPAVSGPWRSVYRAEHASAQVWMAWQGDVDVARAPLPPSVEPRFYWTGDGAPRYAPFSDLSAGGFVVGIPRPIGAPSVVSSGGSGMDMTRVYVYTFYSEDNEEGPPSPASGLITGKVDGAWSISDMDAFPANSGTGVATFASGETTFANVGNHWLRVGDGLVMGGQRVTISAVVDATRFVVPGDFSTETAWVRVAPWNTTNMKRRLYRSAGTVAMYQLVDDDVGTSYSDTLSDAQIMGDELISQSWDAPPTKLRGLIALPNGCLAGFFENQLCYSEPYQPHAWPLEYRRATDFEIVGIAAYGTTVVAATAGLPYVATGTEPATVTMESVGQSWPCLSKRSVVSVGDGVLFATSYGMAYVGASGPTMWTQQIFTRTQWEPLNPTSMQSAASNGKVYVRYATVDGSSGTLVFSPSDADAGLVRLSMAADALYADLRNGGLYIVDGEGVHLFDSPEGVPMDFSWRSKPYSLPTPANLGAAKVDFVSLMSQADYDAEMVRYEAQVQVNESKVVAYSGVGGINGSRLNPLALNASDISNVRPPEVAGLTFTLYCDGRAVFSRTLVDSQMAFRLPSGFKAQEVAVGLSGAVQVRAVKLADTMLGLKQI